MAPYEIRPHGMIRRCRVTGTAADLVCIRPS
jgi:hypothetical protein